MKDGWMYKTAQGEREGWGWDNFFVEGAFTTFANIFQDVAGLVVGVPATAISYIAEDWMGLGFDEQGTWSHHKRIAWTATANALKNSVKEMYQGGITVLGDPTVKPNDRIIINDSYNDMNGQVLVREVVHNLNHRTGFTTTINVDAISTVDDRSEVYKNAKIADIVTTISSIALLHVNIYSLIEIGQEYIDDLSKTTAGQTANEFYKTTTNMVDIKNMSKNSAKRVQIHSRHHHGRKSGIGIHLLYADPHTDPCRIRAETDPSTGGKVVKPGNTGIHLLRNHPGHTVKKGRICLRNCKTMYGKRFFQYIAEQEAVIRLHMNHHIGIHSVSLNFFFPLNTKSLLPK
jgi:hypothetical protein